MTSSASITLRKKANKNGLYPLAIRITKYRRSVYLYIGHYIQIKFWDETKCFVKKSHPYATRLNSLLLIKLAEVNKVLLELQSEGKDLSASQIKKEISFKNSNSNFFDVAEAHLKELKSNSKFGRHSVDKAVIGHISKFYKSKQLSFQELDENLLKKYMTYLRNTPKVSERTIANHLVLIRLLFNKAIRNGMVDRKFYPFGREKIKIKFPECGKVGLTMEEIKKLEQIQSLTKEENHARNVWLFSFYLAGIRIADVLKIRWSDIQDNRIHYTMNKNSKLVSLQLPDKVQGILRNYIKEKRDKNDYIFPDLKKVDSKDKKKFFDKTKRANRKINAHLVNIAGKAGIEKKISMHIARHSFGHIAGDKIPIQMLQKLYRHSSISTTMMYQSYFISSETDKALQNVIDF